MHNIEEPRPTLNCPRLNGYFAHKGVCDKFYYCVDGMFNMITCPGGLVFNPRTGMIKYVTLAIRFSMDDNIHRQRDSIIFNGFNFFLHSK